MTPLVLGVLACSLVAVLVLVVVALPHLREGEDLFSDEGRAKLAASGGRVAALASTAVRRAGEGAEALRRAAQRDDVASADPAEPVSVPVRLPEAPSRPASPRAAVPPSAAVPPPVAAVSGPGPAVPRATQPVMGGVRRTTYRGTGTGDVVSSRSPQWQALAESADPATRAAARVVDLRDTDEAATARAGGPPARAVGQVAPADAQD